MRRWVVKLEVVQPEAGAAGLDEPAAAVAHAVSELRPSVMVADNSMVMAVRVPAANELDAERVVVDLLDDAGARASAEVIDIREELSTVEDLSGI